MILLFALLGGVAGLFLSSRDGESALQGALVGAVGGVAGGIAFWIVVRLLGIFAGALGAVAGALLLVWLFRRWQDR